MVKILVCLLCYAKIDSIYDIDTLYYCVASILPKKVRECCSLCNLWGWGISDVRTLAAPQNSTVPQKKRLLISMHVSKSIPEQEQQTASTKSVNALQWTCSCSNRSMQGTWTTFHQHHQATGNATVTAAKYHSTECCGRS